MVLEAASADRRGRGIGWWPALTAGLYEPHRRRPKTPPRRYGPLASVRGGVCFLSLASRGSREASPSPHTRRAEPGSYCIARDTPSPRRTTRRGRPDEADRCIAAEVMLVP